MILILIHKCLSLDRHPQCPAGGLSISFIVDGGVLPLLFFLTFVMLFSLWWNLEMESRLISWGGGNANLARYRDVPDSQSTILNTLLLLLHDITFAEPCFKGSSLIPIHLCYIYAISPCLFALQMAFGLIYFPCSINDSRAYSQLMYVCAVHGPLYSYFHRTLSGKYPLVYRKWYMFLPTTTLFSWVVNNSYWQGKE